jgi:hypothetical protein
MAIGIMIFAGGMVLGVFEAGLLLLFVIPIGCAILSVLCLQAQNPQDVMQQTLSHYRQRLATEVPPEPEPEPGALSPLGLAAR